MERWRALGRGGGRCRGATAAARRRGRGLAAGGRGGRRVAAAGRAEGRRADAGRGVAAWVGRQEEGCGTGLGLGIRVLFACWALDPIELMG